MRRKMRAIVIGLLVAAFAALSQAQIIGRAADHVSYLRILSRVWGNNLAEDDPQQYAVIGINKITGVSGYTYANNNWDLTNGGFGNRPAGNPQTEATNDIPVIVKWSPSNYLLKAVFCTFLKTPYQNGNEMAYSDAYLHTERQIYLGLKGGQNHPAISLGDSNELVQDVYVYTTMTPCYKICSKTVFAGTNGIISMFPTAGITFHLGFHFQYYVNDDLQVWISFLRYGPISHEVPNDPTKVTEGRTAATEPKWNIYTVAGSVTDNVVNAILGDSNANWFCSDCRLSDNNYRPDIDPFIATNDRKRVLYYIIETIMWEQYIKYCNLVISKSGTCDIDRDAWANSKKISFRKPEDWTNIILQAMFDYEPPGQLQTVIKEALKSVFAHPLNWKRTSKDELFDSIQLVRQKHLPYKDEGQVFIPLSPPSQPRAYFASILSNRNIATNWKIQCKSTPNSGRFCEHSNNFVPSPLTDWPTVFPTSKRYLAQAIYDSSSGWKRVVPDRQPTGRIKGIYIAYLDPKKHPEFSSLVVYIDYSLDVIKECYGGKSDFLKNTLFAGKSLQYLYYVMDKSMDEEEMALYVKTLRTSICTLSDPYRYSSVCYAMRTDKGGFSMKGAVDITSHFDTLIFGRFTGTTKTFQDKKTLAIPSIPDRLLGTMASTPINTNYPAGTAFPCVHEKD